MSKVISLLLLLCFSFAVYPQAVTDATTDGQYIYDGIVKVIYGKSKADSIKGIAVTKNLWLNFNVDPGKEYILARDTLSSITTTGGHRDSAVISIVCEALDTGSNIIGRVWPDSISKNEGSRPYQVLLPFNRTLFGSKYNLKYVSTTAKDSIFLNKTYILARHKQVVDK